MTLTYTVRPISDRSAFAGLAHVSPFRSKWSATLQLLERELEELRARQVVFEVDVRERDIRVDGQIRANAVASSTAVRIAFESRHGPLVYATDRFGYDGWDRPRTLGWQDNVRAIALGIEALRKVDRYGVSRRGEQYRGYKQLSGTQGRGAGMTTELALTIIGNESGLVALDADDGAALSRAIRAAMAATHPDRRGGDRSAFDAVDQARQALQAARYLA